MNLTVEELEAGCRAFEEHDRRDAMYKVTQELLEERWGDWEASADALGVLLLTWNQWAYRYGVFDFNRLQGFLQDRASELESYRARRIVISTKPAMQLPLLRLSTCC